MRLHVFMWFLCIGVSFLSASLSISQEIHFPGQEEAWYKLPENWSPVASEDKVKILRTLVSTIEGSVGKLRSFSGDYAVDYEQTINPVVAKELHVTGFSDDVSMKSFYHVKIYADFQNGKTLRSKKNINELLFENGETKLKTDGITFLDVNSIMSKDGYLFSNDQEFLPSIPELPDFPGTENKRVAWREPPEVAIKRDIVELINPREFFSLETWGNIGVILDSFEGKQGGGSQKSVDRSIFLFEATDEKGMKWFRLHQQLSSRNGSKRDLNIFWSEEAGLHPVCSLYVDNTTRKLKDLIQIKWNKVGGIFVPTASYVVVYDNSGKLSYRRKMTLSDVEVNKPISSEMFTFSALGLEDGDILVDRIKQQVFTIKNDKPVYLAKFYEQYQTPKERAISRFRLALMGIGVALIAWGLFSRYLRKRKEK